MRTRRSIASERENAAGAPEALIEECTVIHYVLFAVSMNVQTGELTRVEQTGLVYDSKQECLQAAQDKGPQRATTDGTVKVYTCAFDRQEVST